MEHQEARQRYLLGKSVVIFDGNGVRYDADEKPS